MSLDLFFDEKVLTDGIDVSEFQDVIDALSCGDYKKVHLKRLKGHRTVFSARTNRKGRVLLSTLKKDGKTYLVVVEYLPNHEYHRSTWLNNNKELDENSSVLQAQLQNDDDGDSEDELEEVDEQASGIFHSVFQEGSAKISPERKKAVYNNQSYICLSEIQESITAEIPPIFFSGGPGSAKTTLIVQAIKKFIKNTPHVTVTRSETNPNEKVTKIDDSVIFFIAGSERLVNSVAINLQDSPIIDKEDDRIQCMSYAEFALFQDDSLKNKKPIGLTEFLAWAENKKLGKLNPATIYKDFRMVSICETFADYQKIGSRNLHYQSDAEMQRIWQLYKDYMSYCQKSELYDLAFTRFKITQKCHLGGLDEAQDLTPIQLMQFMLSVKDNQYYIAMDSHQSILHDRSIRPIFLQMLKQNNYNTLPKHILLKSNHRMPKLVAKVATRVIEMKNHLTGGVGDSDETISLDEVQENDKQGQVKFVHKNEKSADLDEIYAIARRPDTAFIVPDEATRKGVQEQYKVTQVFLVEEAKGLEWANVIVVDILEGKECSKIFNEANGLLPDTEKELRINSNRAKDTTDRENIKYNSAFAKVLVAASRSTENLYFIDSPSREKRKIQSLLRSAITTKEPLLLAQKVEKPLVTRQMWVDQIKTLIDNGNLPQAILTARQELLEFKEIPDTISADELTQKLGFKVRKRRHPAPKKVVQVKKNEPVMESSSSSSTSSAVATNSRAAESVGKEEVTQNTRESKFDRVALNLEDMAFKGKRAQELNALSGAEFVESYCSNSAGLELFPQGTVTNCVFAELCQPVTIKHLLKLLDDPLVKAIPISLKLLMLPIVISGLMTTNIQGIAALGKIFKNSQYYKDNSELEKFFVNEDGKSFTEVMQWLFKTEEGVQFVYDVMYNAPSLQINLLKPLGVTENLYVSKSSIYQNRLGLLICAIAKHLGDPALELAQKLCCRNTRMIEELKSRYIINFSQKNKSYRRGAITQADFKDYINRLLSGIFVSPDYEKLFFMCTIRKNLINSVRENPATSFFIMLLSFDDLTKWLIEFFETHPLYKMKFEQSFSLNCIMPMTYQEDATETNPFPKILWVRHGLIHSCGPEGVAFIISYLSNPKFFKIDLNGTLMPLRNWVSWYSRHILLDPLFWLSFNIDSLYGVQFLYVLASQPQEEIARVIRIKFAQNNLKQSLQEVVGDRRLANWHSDDHGIDMIDLLSMHRVGEVFLLNYFRFGKDQEFHEVFCERIRASLRSHATNLQKSPYYRLLVYNPPKELFTKVLSHIDSSLTTELVHEHELQDREKTRYCQHYEKLAHQAIKPFTLPGSQIHMELADFPIIYIDNILENPLAIVDALFYDNSLRVNTLMEIMSGDNVHIRYFLRKLVAPECIDYIMFHVIPMSVLIAQPYQNCIYNNLMSKSFGRILFGLFLTFQTVCLDSMTVAQLKYSLGYTHKNAIFDVESSLFFALCSFSEKRHKQLLRFLEEDNSLAMVMQKSDLFMGGDDQLFPREQSPYLCLKKTETGSKFLLKLLQLNPQLVDLNRAEEITPAELSSPTSSANLCAGFWSATHNNSAATNSAQSAVEPAQIAVSSTAVGVLSLVQI